MLRGAGRFAEYCKSFELDGEADSDHAFASGALADGLDIAVGPAPCTMSAPLDTGFIDVLRSEAETIIVEAAEGSISYELARALDAPALEVRAYVPRQGWAPRQPTALVVNAVPPYRTDEAAASAAESTAGWPQWWC